MNIFESGNIFLKQTFFNTWRLWKENKNEKEVWYVKNKLWLIEKEWKLQYKKKLDGPALLMTDSPPAYSIILHSSPICVIAGVFEA